MSTPAIRVPLNDLSRALSAEKDLLLHAAAEVLESGWLLRGPQVTAFEKASAAYLGVAHFHTCGNGTDALEIALRAANTDSRRTVITVANAGGYTSAAARAAGYLLRYVDVDETHTVSPTSVADAIDADTFAIVVTHLYGRVADVSHIRKVVDGRPITVIEDCAQAFGAWNVQGKAGTLGDLATFSFYPTKNLGALGDGGGIVASDPKLHARVVGLSQYGWSRRYSVDLPGGRNSRMDELQAAFLNVRLPMLDATNERRREVIDLYRQAASPRVNVLPADDGHAGHLAVVQCDDAANLASHMLAAGIATAVHYPTPDHWQPGFTPTPVSLPVTESMVGRILSLPLFPELTDSEVTVVCEALANY